MKPQSPFIQRLQRSLRTLAWLALPAWGLAAAPLAHSAPVAAPVAAPLPSRSAAPAASPSADLRACVQRFDAKAWADARACLLPLAKAGQVAAQGRWARMLLESWGGPADAPAALSWAQRAAAAGDAQAMVVLGRALRDGLGQPPDAEQAGAWFERAVAAGNTEAAVLLADMLLQHGEHHLRLDVERALALLQRAAERENDEAQVALAFEYLAGAGPRQPALAFELLQRAARHNSPSAFNNLGNMYRLGVHVPRDPVQARQWFERAAARGFALAMSNLGLMDELGEGGPADMQRAARWYLRAAQAGDALAIDKLDVQVLADAAQAVLQAEPQFFAQMTPAMPATPAASNPPPAALPLRLAAGAAPAPATSPAAAAPAPTLASAVPAAPEAQATATAARMAPSVAPVTQLLPTAALAAPLTARRLALVLGNDRYTHVSGLENAGADARAMAQGLAEVGYDVTLRLDLDQKTFKAAWRDFKSRVQSGDEVAIFYAGHGVQLGSANYLLPVDIVGESEDQIKDDSVPMQRLLDDLAEQRTKLALLVVDACRDNPFKGRGRSLGGRGLTPTSAATGQMVIFSAGTGQQALDRLGPQDPHPNGVFTRVFLREMKRSGVSIDRVLRSVRSQVVDLAHSVGHEQVPAIYDQVVGDFFFVR